jgi:hypothetical protein
LNQICVVEHSIFERAAQNQLYLQEDNFKALDMAVLIFKRLVDFGNSDSQ